MDYCNISDTNSTKTTSRIYQTRIGMKRSIEYFISKWIFAEINWKKMLPNLWDINFSQV